MNNKPMIIANDDLSEGVYAGSGSSKDCWDVNVYVDQQDAGVMDGGHYSTFRIKATHSTEVQHLSKKTVVTINFDSTVTKAKYEGFVVQVSGSQVVLTRESDANAYLSGDNFNSLLQVWSPNYQTIKVLGQPTITCIYTANVQGNI